MEEQETNNLSEMISNSLKSLKDLSDSETIIGKPIPTPNGTTVIPISTLKMGFVGGGLDYSRKTGADKNGKKYSETKPNFGGAGGTGISLSPVAFLVISPDGNVEIVPLSGGSGDATADALSTLIEKSPALFEKIKQFFSKKKKKDGDEDEPFEAEVETEAEDDAENNTDEENA